MSIFDWSKTASSNGNSDATINFQEGQAPSTVNDSARALMARIAYWRDWFTGNVTQGGSSNAYTITSGESLSAYTAGMRFLWKPNADSTGAVTLNVDAIGAKKVYLPIGTQAVSGSIDADAVYDVIYQTALDSSNGGFKIVGGTLDADLETLASLTVAANNFIAGNSGGTAWEVKTPTQARTSLGLEIGTDVQASDATLSMYAALGMEDNKTVVGTGVDTAELVDYGTFTGASATETDPAVTVTRTFTGTASERIATMLLQNTGDAAGGSDYQNEVHLRMKTGTAANHRRYIDFMNYDDTNAYVFGVNAENVVIFFDQSTSQHWLWKRPGDAPSSPGDLLFNATGTAGIIRIGYNALSTDTPPPTDIKIYTGDAAPASNFLAFDINAGTGYFTKFSHTDGTTVEFIIEPGGQVGIGKANPSYALDVERTDALPFRFVFQNGSFLQTGLTMTHTTTQTGASDQFTITDQDNSDSRAVLKLLGNAGAVDVLYAASSGKVGIGTGASPTAPLDVSGNTFRLRTARTPASAAAAGNAGDFCWDASYFYICTATNTWRRVAHATW